MHRAILCSSLLAIFLATAPASGAQLRLEELSGDWLSEQYIAALESSHSLLAASEAALPVTFGIERNGSGHRFTVTNFHEATWNTIVRLDAKADGAFAFVVGPYENALPEASDLETMPFIVERDASGRAVRIRMTLWGEENAWFRRIDKPAEQFVNAMLFAGSWHDLDGGRWKFDAAGTITRPDGTVASFSPSIDTMEECCDTLTIDDVRVGIALRDGTMWMYREFEDPAGCPISCDRSRPLRILVRETPGERSSPVALRRLTLAAVTKDGATWGGHGKRIAIELPNIDRRPDPEFFTEPSLVVIDRKKAARCNIDGGIWARDSIWLSADESLIAMATHSGSSSELEIYRTRDCVKTSGEPIAERTLRVDADRIEHDGICEPYGEDSWDCFPAAIWRLRTDGTLEHLADESARRTRGVFGVAFTARSDIEHARTDGARLKQGAEVP